MYIVRAHLRKIVLSKKNMSEKIHLFVHLKLKLNLPSRPRLKLPVQMQESNFPHNMNLFFFYL